MTRRNALLRLHKTLLARRQELGAKQTGELAFLHNGKAVYATGDSADIAFDADGDEISSLLAELGDRELIRIERALARWQLGTFGICASCEKSIPLARLNALPHTAFCIGCEQLMESQTAAPGRPDTGNWNQVHDAQAPMQDQKVDLAELVTQISRER